MTVREIYTSYYSKHYDTAFSGFNSMLKNWRKKHQADSKHLEAGNLQYKFQPHSTTVQVNSDGEVVQSWIKSKANDAAYLELIEAIKTMEPIIHEAHEITTPEDYMLEIPLFDMHFGIADYLYYTQTLSEILRVVRARSYKEINIIIGQDLFHNDDFRGRTSSGREIEQINIKDAWNDARKFYYRIIDECIKHSEKVNIIYSKGNHDESMGWAFVQMIKAQYNLPTDDRFKERKLITFGSNFIGITHGDKKNNKPIELRSIYTIEYPLEFAKSKVREIHAGHLHHEKGQDVYGIMCRSLSSGNEKDNWHDDQGYVGAHKRFTLYEWSLEKLVAIYYV